MSEDNEEQAEEEYAPEQQEEDEEMKAINDEFNRINSENVGLKKSLQDVSNTQMSNPNIIEMQLETGKLLNDLRDFYSGNFQTFDEFGKRIDKKQRNDDLKTFNAFGVNSMMEVVSQYINKNTILSYYTEERIYQIMGSLGNELILLIACNYNKMGMNNQFKKSKFRILVVTTLHMIESSYRRAIRGETFKRVNESRIINQNENLSFGNRNVEPKKSFFSKIKV